jgi:DNA-binding NarL/FixJ family response regulator
VSPIKVVLVGMSAMLRDLVKAILATEPSVRVIGEMDEPSYIHESGIQADMVVLGLRDSKLSELGLQLLTAHPDTKFLGISSDGRTGFLFELRPHAIPLGELSPTVLVDAIVRRTDDTTREE